MTIKIGITERGDAGLDFSWIKDAHKYDGIILITKALSYRFIEEAHKVNSIVHATITGYGRTIYEPNVAPYNISKTLFKTLVDNIGPERVVLRIDPILPNTKGMITALKVYEDLHINFNKMTRVRISFLDNYPHVKQRFIDANLKPLPYYFHAPIEDRKRIASFFPDAEICGEPGFDSIGCISEKDLKILNIPYDPANLPTFKGPQRKECTCLAIKREMLKHIGRCKHECLYCYWK